MAHYLVALLFGTHIPENIWASVHVRAHRKADHLGASELFAYREHVGRNGPSTYGSRAIRYDGYSRVRASGKDGDQ
jgi:hypothetical protein